MIWLLWYKVRCNYFIPAIWRVDLGFCSWNVEIFKFEEVYKCSVIYLPLGSSSSTAKVTSRILCSSSNIIPLFIYTMIHILIRKLTPFLNIFSTLKKENYQNKSIEVNLILLFVRFVPFILIIISRDLSQWENIYSLLSLYSLLVLYYYDNFFFWISSPFLLIEFYNITWMKKVRYYFYEIFFFIWQLISIFFYKEKNIRVWYLYIYNMLKILFILPCT